MIKELENQNYYHKDDDTFRKYFIGYQKKPIEIAKEKELSGLILDFYQTIFDKDVNAISYLMFDNTFVTYGYLDNYGYYEIDYDNHDFYVQGPIETKEEIFIMVIKKILKKKSEFFEKNNRKELKREFKSRFGNIDYTDDLPRYEYELKKWARYFKDEKWMTQFKEDMPQMVIDTYNKSINLNYSFSSNQMRLAYDETTHQFVSQSKEKIRKRK